MSQHTPAEARARLKDLIRERAYRYQPDDPFTLASGRQSPFYFNCKAVTLSGEGLNHLGATLAEELPHFGGIAALGGLTLGADALATSCAMVVTARGQALDAFVIRKEAKGHGTRRWIEGEVPKGTPVVILDDVVTTGGSTIKAIERAHEGGLDIRGVLVLVDREEENGTENIREALRKVGAPAEVRSVFRANDFREE